jgi:hypothetical protein
MPAESSSSWRNFLSRQPRRLIAHWRFKLLLALAITLLFCIPYFLIEHFPLSAPRTLPLGPIDRAIGFHPHAWVWVYQSFYLLINLLPLLADTRHELVRYTRGFAALAGTSLAIFLIYPVRAPQPIVTGATGMYWLLLQYDAPLNCFPSLHAALLVYTLLFARHSVLIDAPSGLMPLLIAWGGLILYATLATKQHYAVDLLAGAALAVIVHAWLWRGSTADGRAASRKILRSSGVMSQDGVR